MSDHNLASVVESGDPKTVLVLISAEEFSKLLGISKRTLWRLLSAGKIVRPIRIGGSVRWRLGEVRAWIESGCKPGM